MSKISICTRKIIIFSLLFTTLLPSISIFAQEKIVQQETPVSKNIESENVDFENLSPEQAEECNAYLVQMLDNMITQNINQLQKIEGVLEEMSLSVDAGAFGNENKNELLDQIKAVRKIINEIKNQAFVEVSPDTIQLLVAFNALLMEHISEAIKKGFKELPPIESKLATLHKRAAGVDLENIEKKIEENEKELQKLSIKAQEIGISWFNKVFRKLNNLFVIAHRKKWDTALIATSVGSLLASHFIMKWTNCGYKKSDKLLKDAAQRAISGGNHNGHVYINEDQPEIIKKYDDYKKALLEEKSQSTRLINLPGKIFRNIFGYPIMMDGKNIAYGKIQSEWNNKVNWYGKTDIALKATAAVIISSYIAPFAFALGENWHSKFGFWFGKKLNVMYGKLMGGSIAKKIEKEQKGIEDSSEPKYNFDDVVGLDHIKRTLNNVLEYMKNPERFDRANIPPERGYLFTGLPGTGKSFVAEAFGGEIRKIFKELGREEDELGFYSLSADLIKREGIQWVINLAKKEAPCVIFIDEIDLLRLQRGNGDSKMLSQFLGSMSGVLSKESSKQVVLLAATNRPEHLDKALRRRGRFGKIIHFELPTVAERKRFLEKRLDPILPDLSIIDIDKLAEETEGRTYEELSVMINSALQTTKRTGIPISHELLEKALDEEIRNIMNLKEITISEQEQTLIASHQAGHALALELLKPRRELAAVTILPITAKLEDEDSYAQYNKQKRQQDVVYGKTFTKCSFDHLDVLTYEEKIKKCKILLAGMCAERILLGACGHSYHANDKQEALDIVKSLMFEGLHVKTMPKKIQLQYFEKAFNLLDKCEKEIQTLLEQNKELLKTIAENLQKYKTLSAKKMKQIVDEYKKSKEKE